jgi:aminoglycoside phosphotransferase (APT) family kinase protein
MSGPPEGTDWRPSASGNSIRWDGSAVVKQYTGRLHAYDREKAVLEALAGRLPVPRPFNGSTRGALRLPYIAGINGRELADLGDPGELMAELGRFLRALHEFDVGPLSGVLPGAGRVLVHGDFGHYNAIFETDRSHLTAVLDWEEAHLGDVVEDIAWCEWQFRSRHPRHEWAVRKLLDSYGDAPDAGRREEAVRSRLQELSTRARSTRQ